MRTGQLDAINDVAGISVGHAHDLEALTGCSVVLCERGAVAGVDVRGGAPGTRETDVCRPGTLVERVHAVLLTGGSSFGLDAAGGVMRYLHERDVGYDTGSAKVPVVPGAVIYDLAIGSPVWPDAAMGYRACTGARSDSTEQGNVGAGAGATVGKVLGLVGAVKGGLGTASVRVGGFTVGALVVVNALGDVIEPDRGVITAGARDPDTGAYVDAERWLLENADAAPGPTNTTLGVVATDAVLTDTQTARLATVAHDGLARTIRPVHTMYDGDVIFALATGESGSAGGDAMLRLETATVRAVERAVLNAVLHAVPAVGLPAAVDGKEGFGCA